MLMKKKKTVAEKFSNELLHVCWFLKVSCNRHKSTIADALWTSSMINMLKCGPKSVSSHTTFVLEVLVIFHYD